jgi:hypothetical protein
MLAGAGAEHEVFEGDPEPLDRVVEAGAGPGPGSFAAEERGVPAGLRGGVELGVCFHRPARRHVRRDGLL